MLPLTRVYPVRVTNRRRGRPAQGVSVVFRPACVPRTSALGACVEKPTKGGLFLFYVLFPLGFLGSLALAITGDIDARLVLRV